MASLSIELHPGPKALAAALKLAGFSETSVYGPVTDAAGTHWPSPSGLQLALAICGGESSGNVWCYHENHDGSVDYGMLEINAKWHPKYFNQTGPTAWNWTNYLDNAKAAYELHKDSDWGWGAWNAYTNGGYLHVRYGVKTWMDWANFGIVSMLGSLGMLKATGMTEARALAQMASVNNDPMVYD